MPQTEIRGEGRTEKDNMDFGQVRKVFDPDWIQSFSGGKVTIQFQEEVEGRDEALKNFMEMRGYEFVSEKTRNWKDYRFQR